MILPVQAQPVMRIGNATTKYTLKIQEGIDPSQPVTRCQACCTACNLIPHIGFRLLCKAECMLERPNCVCRN